MVTRRPSEEIARLGDEIYERDGMRLLDGHSLYVEVVDGGCVVIEPTATG